MVDSSIVPIRVLLIDDHELVRAGLRLLIESHPGLVIVGEAANRDQALQMVAQEQPDIILLDLSLGAERGVDLLPDLRAAARETRVIVLTAIIDQEDHRQAIRHGAMGLVLKDQAVDVLITAIKQVHAGAVWMEPKLAMSAILDLAQNDQQVDPNPARIASLSMREREVIELISAGFKNKQIAQRMEISEATVSHYLTTIYDKLDVNSRFELIIFALRNRLVQLPN